MCIRDRTWTLRKRDGDRLDVPEVWIWMEVEGVIGADKIHNNKVLNRIKKSRTLLWIIKIRKRIGHDLRTNELPTVFQSTEVGVKK